MVSNQDHRIEDFKSVYRDLPYEQSVIFYEHGAPPQIRMEAVTKALINLGGLYALIGDLLSAFPLWLTNPVYQVIAYLRHKIFLKPAQACPAVPKEFLQQLSPPEDYQS
jgi:predicted DCC family thiol-disulfide oxidoreductase YuxK